MPLQPRPRIRRKRQQLWLALIGLVIAGLILGSATSAAGAQIRSGTALVALAALAAIYRPAAGMAVFAFSLPFGLAANVGPWEIDASTAIMAVVAVSWLARAVNSHSWKWRTKRLDLAAAIFAGATILSLAATTGLAHRQLVPVAVTMSAFLVFFLASRTVRARIDLWLVVGGMILSTLFLATGIAFNVLTRNLVVSEDTRVSGDLTDPNHFAGTLVVVCLLVVAVGIRYPRVWSTISTILVSLILSVVLLATLSRSSWLGLGSGVVILLLLLPKHRRQIVVIAGSITVVLIAAGMAGPVAARLSPHATGPMEMLASRWRVWTAAVAMTSDHPFFGVGLDNFGVYYPLYSARPIAVDHAHNLFLNILAERGIFALLGFSNVVIAFFITVSKALRRASSELRIFGAGLIASFGGYLVHSLFDVSYYDARVLFLVWILIGLAAALPRLTESAIADPEASCAPVPVSTALAELA